MQVTGSFYAMPFILDKPINNLYNRVMSNESLQDWDGNLDQFVQKMTDMVVKAKEYGLEAMVLVRDNDPIGRKTSYRCIRTCDYIVAIGMLTIAMDDMMGGDDMEDDNG